MSNMPQTILSRMPRDKTKGTTNNGTTRIRGFAGGDVGKNEDGLTAPAVEVRTNPLETTAQTLQDLGSALKFKQQHRINVTVVILTIIKVFVPERSFFFESCFFQHGYSSGI